MNYKINFFKWWIIPITQTYSNEILFGVSITNVSQRTKAFGIGFFTNKQFILLFERKQKCNL